MRISSACHRRQPTFDQLVRHCLGVGNHLVDIVGELGTQRFAERNRFCGNHVHERPALNSGKDRGVELLCKRLFVRQDHPTPWTAQGLVRRRRGDMGMGEGRRISTRRDETCKMRHIHQEIGTNHIGNGPELLEIQNPRDRGSARDDHLGLVFLRQRFDLVVVGQQVIFPNAVLDRVEPFAGLVGPCAVCEMSTGIKAHAQNGVPRLQQRGEDALVRLTARVGLNIRETATEELLRPIYCKVLGNVHELAPAIVPAAGVAFRILVCHDAALCFHDSRRDDVFAGNQFDLVALATKFLTHSGGKFRVAGCKAFREEAVVAMRGVHWCTPIGSVGMAVYLAQGRRVRKGIFDASLPQYETKGCCRSVPGLVFGHGLDTLAVGGVGYECATVELSGQCQRGCTVGTRSIDDPLWAGIAGGSGRRCGSWRGRFHA